MVKRLVLLLLILGIGLAAFSTIKMLPQAPIASAYAAKKMCSCTFIANRTQESIQDEDLDLGPLKFTKTNISLEDKSATSSLFGLYPKTAIYRDDIGCVLIHGKDDFGSTLVLDSPNNVNERLWPFGRNVDYNSLSFGVDSKKMKQAVSNAFDPDFREGSQKTRAVVIVKNGRLIYEEYADGFDAETEILGWSMTKSIASTLIGILTKNGKASLDESSIFTNWTDQRKDIKLRHLLQMQSGLAFEEEYGSVSDATKMLFMEENVASIPMNENIQYPPNTHWSYSSGTTNLLSEFIRNRVSDQDAYLRFPYDSLFHRIGMHSTTMETDESGRFIMSSYCYATPRDWAKFGLLYLRQGNWFGDQVIDTSWVKFVRTPASESKGKYGGQFWLNVDKSSFPDAPEDLYYANGFQGQHVFIIPSKDLIIVRMGLSEYPGFNANKFLKEVLDSFPDENTNTN